MTVHGTQQKLPVKPQDSFNKLNLEYIPEMKFLGIYVTETLKWNSQIQSFANRLSKVPFMIKPLKEILSFYMIQNVYFTKLQALLRCGILFCGGE